ncbi:MAG: hypothetical protein IPH12_06780 [Saprospirales bacterium]|nr:hypothetical protein [Saprospirales bacterium]
MKGLGFFSGSAKNPDSRAVVVCPPGRAFRIFPADHPWRGVFHRINLQKSREKTNGRAFGAPNQVRPFKMQRKSVNFVKIYCNEYTASFGERGKSEKVWIGQPNISFDELLRKSVPNWHVRRCIPARTLPNALAYPA